MKVLFIGGTGTISSAISRKLALRGDELYLLNRGNREMPGNVKWIRCDIGDEQAAATALEGLNFDVVCDFIGFVPEQLERDYRLFRGRTTGSPRGRPWPIPTGNIPGTRLPAKSI